MMDSNAPHHSEPAIGIIGGTGLGEALRDGFDPAGIETHEIDTPFGRPSAPVITGMRDGVRLALLNRHGEGHVFNPTAVPYRANIFALKTLGVTHLIASGATGSLRESIRPGDVCVCDGLIDRTYRRPNTFYEHAAVHVEFADPFCPVLRRWLLDAASRVDGVTVHDGATYVCMEGPAFSTRAEAAMHRQWGGDVIGMTACPEAKLAREAEIAYALLALPTDDDCWRPRDPASSATDAASLIAEIIGNLRRAADACLRVITEALRDPAPLRTTSSPAHDALALGIWTAKDRIDADEIQRLRPLWGRHFEGAMHDAAPPSAHSARSPSGRG